MRKEQTGNNLLKAHHQTERRVQFPLDVIIW